MLPNEVKTVGALLGDAVAKPAGVAGDVHRAVSRRTFGALGVLGAPVRILHDAISTAAYSSVRAATSALPAGIGRAMAPLAPPEPAPLALSPGGSVALGVLNGAYGDTVVRRYRDLALELTIRHRGRDLPLDPDALTAALPEATPRLAIFVHGLCETDAAWQLRFGAGTGDTRSYGARLRDELGYTPLYVRYNTGLHVSDNGRRLADDLERLVQAWPTEIERIALIGHSMGGLVARSACRYGELADHDWTGRVRDVFCLGTPHLGAPLEKGANVFGWALGRVPETRPFAELVNLRSAGIKDLRYGNCIEDDWCDCDPDEFLNDRCHEVPFLACATYYFIGATLARDPASPLGAIVGDLLVQFSSASGRGKRRRIPFEMENGCHVGGVSHMQLLNHPAVYAQIRAWLERSGAATTAPSPR